MARSWEAHRRVTSHWILDDSTQLDRNKASYGCVVINSRRFFCLSSYTILSWELSENEEASSVSSVVSLSSSRVLLFENGMMFSVAPVGETPRGNVTSKMTWEDRRKSFPSRFYVIGSTFAPCGRCSKTFLVMRDGGYAPRRRGNVSRRKLARPFKKPGAR